MGICLSNHIILESPSHTGVTSQKVVTDGNSTSISEGNASILPPNPRSEDEIFLSPNLKSFSFSALRSATRNFRLDNVLGDGVFSSVFKGWIEEPSCHASKPGIGVMVAVRRLNQDGLRGHRKLLEEGQFSHPNLVELIGYCLEDEHRYLVYEFMPRGSLDDHLFRRGSYFHSLSWILRLKTALDAAKGLAFLHSSQTKVIYRDFKTSNILLDSVSSYQNVSSVYQNSRLVKELPLRGQSHVSTRVMGTYGYAAPEYLSTGHLTAKSDVYSFGVVLLEMLSGKRAVDKNRSAGERNLVEWARPYLGNKRRILRVMDSRLEGQYSLDDAHRAAVLSSRCISIDPRFRPRMVDVVKELEQLQGTNGTGRKSNHLARPRPLVHSHELSTQPG